MVNNVNPRLRFFCVLVVYSEKRSISQIAELGLYFPQITSSAVRQNACDSDIAMSTIDLRRAHVAYVCAGSPTVSLVRLVSDPVDLRSGAE